MGGGVHQSTKTRTKESVRANRMNNNPARQAERTRRRAGAVNDPDRGAGASGLEF